MVAKASRRPARCHGAGAKMLFVFPIRAERAHGAEPGDAAACHEPLTRDAMKSLVSDHRGTLL